MRCNDCNKFVGVDDSQEPEVNDLAIDEDGHVTANVRIVNACAECGSELTEANLECETDDTKAHEHLSGHKAGHDFNLEIEEANAERDSKTEGKGRGMKTFYGAKVTATVSCTCGKYEGEVELSGYEQASCMESCQ